MLLIYISSPYTIGDTGANVAVQMEAAHKIMDLGAAPIAPLLSHFLHIHRQRSYDDWMAVDLAIIPKVDAVLRLPGESAGAAQECELAMELGIPVFTEWAELTEFLNDGDL